MTAFDGSDGAPRAGHVIALTFENASTELCLTGADPAKTRVSAFRGKSANSWIPSMPVFHEVWMYHLYRDLDVQFEIRDSGLEYTLNLGSTADLDQFVTRVDGSTDIRLDQCGDLMIETPLGSIRQSIPRCYELDRLGIRREVVAQFRLLGNQRFGILAHRTFANSSLVIDPLLSYATYLGGSGFDNVKYISVHPGGVAFLAGEAPAGFPTTPGAFETTYNGGSTDVFITRSTAAGSSVDYSTYLGSGTLDECRGMAVDGFLDASVSVATTSTLMPITIGAFQSQFGGAYIAKLAPMGDAIVFGTYFGGNQTSGSVLAADELGNVYETGGVIQNDIPTTPGAYSVVPIGGGDFFSVKFSQDGTSLIYSTYLGGSQSDTNYAVTVSPDHSTLYCGETFSPDLPSTSGAFQSNLNGFSDAFILKLSPDGSSVAFSSYIGGNAGFVNERGIGVAVGADGCPVVIGWTYAPDFPFVAGSIDMGFPPGWPRPFVVKFTPQGDQLVFSARLSSSIGLGLGGVAIDANNNVVLAGGAGKDFPTTSDALPMPGGSATSSKALLTKLGPLGKGFVFTTLYGGNGNDGASAGVGLDMFGAAYIAGLTNSTHLPVTSNAFDKTFNGYYDTWFGKFNIPLYPMGVSGYGSGTPGCAGPQTLLCESSLRSAPGNFTLECNHAPPNALGLILVSDQQDLAGSDPFYLGILLHVGMFTTNLSGLDIVSTNMDTASVTLSLPDLTSIIGSTFYAQAVWLWPPATCTPSPFGLSSSSALSITVIQ